MHSFIFSASFEFAFAAILFVFHQSQDLVPRSSQSLSWPPFWINFHSSWTNQSRDFCCVPGSSLLPPPYWKARRPWGRGWLKSTTTNGWRHFGQSEQRKSSALFPFQSEESPDSGIFTCDLTRKCIMPSSHERHKGIIGRGHDLRLLLQQTACQGMKI